MENHDPMHDPFIEECKRIAEEENRERKRIIEEENAEKLRKSNAPIFRKIGKGLLWIFGITFIFECFGVDTNLIGIFVFTVFPLALFFLKQADNRELEVKFKHFERESECPRCKSHRVKQINFKKSGSSIVDTVVKRDIRNKDGEIIGNYDGLAKERTNEYCFTYRCELCKNEFELNFNCQCNTGESQS